MSLSGVDPVVAGLGVAALLGVLLAFRGGARAGTRVARKTREVSRVGGLLARALGIGTVIAGVQWLVIVTTADPVAWGVALGLPAVFAGSALARVFVVTTVEHGGGRGKGAR